MVLSSMCVNWFTKAAADGKALIIGFISQSMGTCRITKITD